ncbi:MAG: tryptophan synthase subunit alpha [Clostridiales Family XIII bacterium]|jgi:tryptophan synthase alpha chain|nr:tryptophan synthase subunit alpha [Clostridiales Family XIII bacterium]
MNSKISAAFENGNKAFIAYLMAGDPDVGKTREYILKMAEAGADIIELGVPFSDPIAEGETIQKANLRAFASGTSGLDSAFGIARSLKGALKAPLLFMTYVNPVFNFGYSRFFAECAACGVSGAILPDLPFEEQGELSGHAQRHGIDIITLIAPTSSARIEKLSKNAQGFIYLVSSLGVTGVRAEIGAGIPAIVSEIRKHSATPVAVGFGIHSPSQAADLARHADGVIVGSAIVDIIAGHGADAADPLYSYVRSMKRAMQG